MNCDGSCIWVYNNCLSSNKIWINSESLSNCDQKELCGLYKKDYNTSLLEYEVFHIKY